MRRKRQVPKRDASIPRKSAEAGDTLGRGSHSSVVGYFAFQQEPILCCCRHTDLDGLLVCGFVLQRETARTSETVRLPTSSLTGVTSDYAQNPLNERNGPLVTVIEGLA